MFKFNKLKIIFINRILFHEKTGNVIAADSKIIKLYNK